MINILRDYFSNKAEKSTSVKALETSIDTINDTKTLINALTDELEAKESALVKSEKKYRMMYELTMSIIDAIPGAVWGKDLSGRFILTNKTLRESLMDSCSIEDSLGITDKEAAIRAGKGDTLHEVVTQNDKAVIESEQPMNFIESGMVNGEQRIFKVVKAPLYDQFGVLMGTVGFGRDITYQCSAAFEILTGMQDATDTCPRECIYAQEVNEILGNAIDILREIISTTCDLSTRPPRRAKNDE